MRAASSLALPPLWCELGWEGGTPISPGGLSAPPRGSAGLLLSWGGAYLELQSISGSGPPAPFFLLPEASLCRALALQGIQVVLPLLGGVWDLLAWGAVGASAGGMHGPRSWRGPATKGYLSRVPANSLERPLGACGRSLSA